MKIGIGGFRFTGKTTLFNALTGVNSSVQARGGQHIGTISIPDPRVDSLAEIYQAPKKTFDTIQFIDFEADKSTEKSISPKDLDDYSKMDVLLIVLDGFTNSVSDNSIIQEIEKIQMEFSIRDAGILENKLNRLKKTPNAEKEPAWIKPWLEKLQNTLFVTPDFSKEEEAYFKPFGLMFSKPKLYIVNLNESQVAFKAGSELQKFQQEHRLETAFVPAVLEQEIRQLDPKDQLAFCKNLGIPDLSINTVIHQSFKLLDLISFYTAGPTESRAWSVKRDASILDAAERIHTDLRRGFIKATVIHYDEFVQYKSEKLCTQAGKMRLEGREYTVKDGDIITIRFNV